MLTKGIGEPTYRLLLSLNVSCIEGSLLDAQGCSAVTRGKYIILWRPSWSLKCLGACVLPQSMRYLKAGWDLVQRDQWGVQLPCLEILNIWYRDPPNPPLGTGPDGISGHMLHNTTISIYPALTRIFNISLTQQKFSLLGKPLMLTLYPNLVISPVTPTTDPSLYSLYLPKFSKE